MTGIELMKLDNLKNKQKPRRKLQARKAQVRTKKAKALPDDETWFDMLIQRAIQEQARSSHGFWRILRKLVLAERARPISDTETKEVSGVTSPRPRPGSHPVRRLGQATPPYKGTNPARKAKRTKPGTS